MLSLCKDCTASPRHDFALYPTLNLPLGAGRRRDPLVVLAAAAADWHNSLMRLDKLLSDNRRASRKEIKALIKSGAIRLDGRPLTDPGLNLSAADAQGLTLNGQPLVLRQELHLMMNKAAGYITALSDPKWPCVSELLPDALYHKDLIPVGRLDKDTVGLLLWTTDGQLDHRLCQPKWAIAKRYFFAYSGPAFNDADCARLAAGLQTQAGEVFKAAELRPLADGTAELVLREGKFHEVKRLVAALGREVLFLKRLSFGPLELDPELDEGESRELTAEEIAALYEACELSPPATR